MLFSALGRANLVPLLVLLVFSCFVAQGCKLKLAAGRVGDAPSERGSSSLPPSLAPAPGMEPEPPAPSTRFARLTHLQWHNSVRDLLQLEPAAAVVADLRPDPVQNGFVFDDNAAALEVDEALWKGYQQAAERGAELVTSDPGSLSRLLPLDQGDPAARARGFIREFGLRAYRRPLTASESERHFQLFSAAAPLYPSMPSFEAGIRVLIETFLQSPHFLYRVERSTQATNGLVPLDSYEVASRLSYLLWNSMPDDALLAAAAADELIHPEPLFAHAQRMLNDPRAASSIGAFHRQLLDVEAVFHAHPSRTPFPNISEQFAEHAAHENELFIRDAVLGQGADYASLLTSPKTFVNAELAQVYGLHGSFGADFVPVMLEPSKRSGVLTQVAFLAANATSVDPDPIHRGVFVARRIACLGIAAPPADIPPLPDPMGRTNRETVASHTEQPNTICASCHTPLINPFGFPFEHYDAVGGYRDLDRGLPVDASAAPLIGGLNVPVNNAVELTQALAHSRPVHECYIKHWLQFAYGRPEVDSDNALIQRLTDASLHGTPIRDILLGLTQTAAFLARSTEELP